MNKKAQEQRLRRRAHKYGLRLSKSRARISLDNFGEYMIVDEKTNFVVAGRRYDYTLDDVAEYLKELE